MEHLDPCPGFYKATNTIKIGDAGEIWRMTGHEYLDRLLASSTLNGG